MASLVKKRIFIKSSGLRCESNAYLTTQLMNFFKTNGCQDVAIPIRADVIVVTTCGFRKQERDNSSASLEELLKNFPDKEFIVSGCLVDIDSKIKEDKRITCVGVKELSKLDKIFNAKVSCADTKANLIRDDFFPDITPKDFFVQISQGCVNNCTYCVIKKAKKFVTSKPPEEVIKEIKEGICLKKKRILLIADDCGSYGVDLKTDFADLLSRLVELPQLYKTDSRYYINTFEPHRLELLFPKLKKALLSNRIGHMSIDIQSGSNRIIKLMNRNYRVSNILKTVSAMKKLSPKTTFDTEIIFCFPTETRKEFSQSIKAAIFFGEALFIKYSRPIDNNLAYLGEEISEEECLYRLEIISKLSKITKGRIKAHI